MRTAVLLHAMVPFRPDESPDLAGTRVLVTGGRSDPMIPLDQTEELVSILRDGGADVELEVAPGGHELTTPELQKVHDWIADAP